MSIKQRVVICKIESIYARCGNRDKPRKKTPNDQRFMQIRRLRSTVVDVRRMESCSRRWRDAGSKLWCFAKPMLTERSFANASQPADWSDDVTRCSDGTAGATRVLQYDAYNTEWACFINVRSTVDRCCRKKNRENRIKRKRRNVSRWTSQHSRETSRNHDCSLWRQCCCDN